MGPFSRLQFVPPPVRHALSICCGSITISFFDLRAKYPIRRRDGAIDQFPFPSFLQSTPHSQNERALSPTHFSVVLTSLFTYHYLRVICYIEDICLHVTVSVSRCFHMTQAKLIVKDLLSKDSRCLTRQKKSDSCFIWKDKHSNPNENFMAYQVGIQDIAKQMQKI